jgi:nicotinamide-nucleotide amidase
MAGEHLSFEDQLTDLHVRLRTAGETVGVAESLTGGLLAAALTQTPGASTTFRGGFVAYATDLKSSLVGVAESLLVSRGAVDPAVAQALAVGARDRLGASWGVGVTGVAGPDPQDGIPVGTVFVAVVGPGLEFPPETVAQLNVDGDRNMIRVKTVEHAVVLLRTALIERERDRSGLVES